MQIEPHPTRLARALLIPAALALAAGGCSKIRWGYPWLDWALESRAERYLDLDAAQEEELERIVANYVEWHRDVMLPRYAATLRRIAGTARSGPFDVAQADDAIARVRGLWTSTLTAAAPGSARLLAAQRPEQIDSLEARLAERQAELSDDSQEDAAERRQERADDTVQQLEDLVGPLRPEQEAQVRRKLSAMGGQRHWWLSERARRNSLLVTKLRAGASADDMETFLTAWWAGELRSPDPAYEAYRARFSRDLDDTFRDLLTSLDATQRQTLAKSLDVYVVDFEVLIGDRSSVRQ